MSCVTCHVSQVTCHVHVSCVRCHVSHVVCHSFFFDIVVELVGQESAINTGPTNLMILHKFAMYGMVHFLLVLMIFLLVFPLNKTQLKHMGAV